MIQFPSAGRLEAAWEIHPSAASASSADPFGPRTEECGRAYSAALARVRDGAVAALLSSDASEAALLPLLKLFSRTSRALRAVQGGGQCAVRS